MLPLIRSKPWFRRISIIRRALKLISGAPTCRPSFNEQRCKSAVAFRRERRVRVSHCSLLTVDATAMSDTPPMSISHAMP